RQRGPAWPDDAVRGNPRSHDPAPGSVRSVRPAQRAEPPDAVRPAEPVRPVPTAGAARALRPARSVRPARSGFTEGTFDAVAYQSDSNQDMATFTLQLDNGEQFTLLVFVGPDLTVCDFF